MDFSALVPSDISDNLGAAVAANVAIRAVVVANSASELPLMLFTFLMILFSVCFMILSLSRLVGNKFLFVIAPIEQFLCQSEKNGKIILLYRQNHYFFAFT
jgi:hypothetical protein